MKNSNFLDWLKEIEIKNLNKKFEKKIDDFDKFKSNFIKENIQIQISKIKKYKIKENLILENLKLENLKDIRKINTKEKTKIDWLLELFQIEDFFKEENMQLNKVWKYKILYFIYAAFIYVDEITNKGIKNLIDKNKLKENERFFLNEEGVYWYAFANGPITNHYNYFGKDKKIEIDFERINLTMKSILEQCYLVLKNLGIQTLIDESHKTNPWNKNYKEDKKWIKIEKKEIIKFFKNNPPFYMKDF